MKDDIIQKILFIVILITSLTINAALGPIPIYLNTEYRTNNPVIDSIASTLNFNENDINKRGAKSFLEFLATIPSINLFNIQGNIPAIFIRGNEARHTLVLVDGVSINDISSTDGAPGYGLSTISINNIEKIEIIKGSGSILYGNSAIGGIIAITPKKGANSTNTTLNLSSGANNSRRYAFYISLGNKDNFVIFNGSKYTTDGISAKSDNTEKDGIKNNAINLKFGTKFGFVKTTLDISSNNSKIQYDACGFGAIASNDCLNDRGSKTINLIAENKFSDIWYSKLSLSQINHRRKHYTNRILEALSGDKFKSIDLTLLNDIKLNNALLNIGLSKINNANTTNSQKLSSKDMFINWQKNISNIDVNTGIRFINHNKFGKRTIYSLGFAKSIKNNIRLTTSYNNAFNAPSIYQLTDMPTLHPEISKNIEISIEKRYNLGLSFIKVYKNKIKDFIDYHYSTTNPHHYSNKDKLNIKGIELSISTNIQDYQINFNHNYVKSVLNNNNTQQFRRPKNTTNLTINKQYTQFDLYLQVVNKSSSLDIGKLKLKSYTLVNLTTNYHYNNNTKLVLNIKNAFNKIYTVIDGFNQPGRLINFDISYQF